VTDSRKRKIKTLKLRGELSQGLFVPRSDGFPMDASMWVEGRDVTKVLGIGKRVVEDCSTVPMPGERRLHS
jgi:hypothetical protein